MKKSIIQDLSTLTTIPITAFKKLNSLSVKLICDGLIEDKLENEIISEFSIGIGTLIIKRDEDTLRYKFVPSVFLESMITDTLRNNKSPLEKEIEEDIKSKVMNTYKDIL